MALRLEIAGITRKRDELHALIGHLEDMGPLWERYGEIMAETETEWFESLGEGSWPALAESTAKWKEARDFPLIPLHRTEILRESLTDPLQAMEIDQGRSTLGTFTRNSMTWGTDVTEADEYAVDGRVGSAREREYAHYHQGTDPVTGEPVGYAPDPPLRQVIPWPLPLHTIAQMDRADEDFVNEAIRKSGLE